LNYGILRPKTFYSGDFENLIMPSLGADFKVNERFTIGVYGYYLRSFEQGAGMFDGDPKWLSPDLGSEVDLYLDYQIRDGILVSLLGGYFIPGHYYREMRDDTDGSVLSPFVRGDGKANAAYQIELALELKF